MKRIFSSILFFASITLSWPQTPELVKEIRPGSADGITNFLEQPFAEFNGRIYFAADDGTTGTELWVSDGTEAGTKLLKDLNEGAEGSDCQKFYPTANYLFFVATDEEHGRELWRTDGTEDGTNMIMDINIGVADGVYYESPAGAGLRPVPLLSMQHDKPICLFSFAMYSPLNNMPDMFSQTTTLPHKSKAL